MEKLVQFNDRELKEIQHALYYAENLSHGTVGHNMLLIIAKLAKEQGFWLQGTELMYSASNAYNFFKTREEMP